MTKNACLVAGLSYILTANTLVSAAEPVDYLREVRPVLAARCFTCHGAVRQKNGLRLDTAAFIRQGGEHGPAIQAGDSTHSLLVERVSGMKGQPRMPPKSEGTPLTDQQIATLRAWIDQGAKAPPDAIPPNPREHWAFRVPVRPDVPRTSHMREGQNPIDAFLAAVQERQGLRPLPPTSKDLWLRRVYLDLIGLPPTREELHAFRADDTRDAYDKVVDRLLASPGYGERWGRHWMDIWRYSDWFGLGQEVRFSHKHLWHWRDWIVESLNADKGYDRMIQEMLAGDELAPADPQTLRATGFLVRNWYIFNRNFWLEDVVQHTSRAFLGLTFQCARCHDHKYDPIAQADYYRFRAFFEPHLVRLDRVPGEPNRDKAGLPRVYDALLDTPTYLFTRGDENHPYKSRALQPGVPEILGGQVAITPVSLPLTASCPDKQDFIIQELLASKERAITQAKAAREKAEQNVAQTKQALAAAIDADDKALAKLRGLADKPAEAKSVQAAAVQAAAALAKAQQAARSAPEELRQAHVGLALAEARHTASQAVLRAEHLEDAGGRDKASEAWTKAAQEAALAQRQLAALEAKHNQIAAHRAATRAQASLDGLTVTVENHKDDKNLPASLQKAATELVEARAKLDAADRQLVQAEAALQQPVTTAYTPRPLAFPRAPISYREQPPNTPYPKVSSGRRLALARWITDRNNPLTARVAVNHIWARHFGEPLAASVFDFGLRTKQPLHHDLLDWLAVEFMESGWSMKQLHRLLVTSQAYRLSSAGERADDSNLRIDPDNRSFWHMNLRRLEGEVLRDSLLHLAGRLNPALGGPDLPVAIAETGTRRTIYYRYARDDRISFLTLFDAPSVEECYRRHETIVPQQALVMSNSKMVLTRAVELAAVIRHEVGQDDNQQTRIAFISSAFERILGRLPTEPEQAECAAALASLSRVDLVHVLLNHNDFITIR
jgi:hypothetical protein